MNAISTVNSQARLFRPALPGLLAAVLTILFGFGLGIVFGLNEDLIKGRLKQSATEVRESVYHGDDAAAKTVLDKSWAYMQRAHLHAGALGATALGLILVGVVMGMSTAWTRLVSFSLGFGAFSYSIFWLFAGLRAPGLGGTTAAKESLRLLAMPSSGALVVGTLAVLSFIGIAMISQPRATVKQPFTEKEHYEENTVQ